MTGRTLVPVVVGLTVPGETGLSLPERAGSYALVLTLSRPETVRVGRLGEFEFPAGVYCYLGSALGGLRTRVSRHLRGDKVRHWHVDYLTVLPGVTVSQVLWTEGGRRLECQWAAATLRLPGSALPAPGFGSSDCRCPSHLVYLGTGARLPGVLDEVRLQLAESEHGSP